jgi:hypothetical protein
MTTPDGGPIVLTVQKALENIRVSFEPTEWVVEPDGAGGVRLRFGPVALSARYVQRESWMAAQLPAQLPYADIYPVFVRGDLTRVDGSPLMAPLTAGHIFMGQAAVQASRRSPRRNPNETATMKLRKVLDWINAQ